MKLRTSALTSTLGCALLLLFAAHAFCFFNPTYSGPSVMLNAAKGASAQASGGQYLLPLYWRVRGAISAPLIVGMLSALYLAASVILTADLLGLRSRVLCFALCGAMTVNAGVTSLFAASLHTADAAFLAQLLSTAAIWLCLRVRLGWLPGALLLAASGALHADGLACGAALALVAMLCQLAEGKPVRRCALSLLSLGAGAALYAVGYAVLIRLRGIEPGARLRLPSSLAEAFLAPLRALLAPLTAYPVLNVALRAALLLTAVAALAWLLRRIAMARAAAIAGLLLLLPLCASLPVLAASDAAQFRLSYAYLDAAVIALIAHAASGAAPLARRLRRAAAGGFAVLFLGCVVFSNQVYLKKNLELSSTLSVMTRVIDRIEQTDGFKPGYTPTAIVGTPEDSVLSAAHLGFEHLAALDAAKANYAVTSSQEMVWYIWEVLGYPLNLVSDFELEQLRQREDVQTMPVFPAEGCCQMIDGTLVVRLSP
ncbi:MAG: glucosyltransferase domain-containing protein [Candidatus Ventricola sp.]